MKLWYDIILWHITEMYAHVKSAFLPNGMFLKIINKFTYSRYADRSHDSNKSYLFFFPQHMQFLYIVITHSNGLDFPLKVLIPPNTRDNPSARGGGGGGGEEISDGMKR